MAKTPAKTKRGAKAVGDKNPRSATEVDAAIGRRLRARRLSIGMSQERLAELVGVTFQQIQKYEKGVNRIAASTLVDLAGALKMPASQLLPEENEQPVSMVVPSADADAEEMRRLLSGLNAEGRRMLFKVARGFATDAEFVLRRRLKDS